MLIVKKVMSASFSDLQPGSHGGQERVRVNPGRGEKWRLAVALALGLMAQCAVAQSSSTPSRGSSDATERKTLVVLGDSLAAGYGVDPAEAYPAVLQRLLDDAGLGFRVVNAGISGDTSAGARRRVDWMLRNPVDALLLQIGGNDGLRGQSPAALKTNLVAIIERTRAKYPEVRVVVAGMKMPSNMGAYANEFERVFVDVAREQRATLIPFLLEGVGGVPELNLPDGIHPTPEGHRHVASNVWAVLQPVLKRAPAPTEKSR
jgi:acyl-CoA thioesterase-1